MGGEYIRRSETVDFRTVLIRFCPKWYGEERIVEHLDRVLVVVEIV